VHGADARELGFFAPRGSLAVSRLRFEYSTSRATVDFPDPDTP
jgi:hypothetical protein